MYNKNANADDAGWVVQIKIDHDPDWKLGSTWVIEKIECGEEKCPVFVRAGGGTNNSVQRIILQNTE